MQWNDSYINLLWYGSRHYDPELGRFTSPDTIVPLASQGVQAWDRFAYANNNPLRYTDPTGHDPVLGFIQGFLNEFSRTTIWWHPGYQEKFAIKDSETDAELAGRLVADIVSTVYAINEVNTGAGMAATGVVSLPDCATSVLCAVSVGAVGAGSTLIVQAGGTAVRVGEGVGTIIAMASQRNRDRSGSQGGESGDVKLMIAISQDLQSRYTKMATRILRTSKLKVDMELGSMICM